MTISIKSIALVTLTTLSLTTGLTMSQASAETTRLRRQVRQPIQTQPVFQPSVKKYATPISVKGNWQGNMGNSGDDVLTHIELSIGVNNNGIWKHHGSQYNANTGKWESKILQQGYLTASNQGSNINIKLNGFSGNSVILEGTLQNNGTKISGDIVGTSFGVFHLNKQ